MNFPETFFRRLTTREREVAELLMDELTQAEAARQLKISPARIAQLRRALRHRYLRASKESQLQEFLAT